MLPGGKTASRSRDRWRSRRLTRLRVTAGPMARETTKPTRGARGCRPVLGRGRPEVDDHQLTATATATAYDLTEVERRGQAVAGGEHARLLLGPQPQAARRLRPLRRRDGQDRAAGAGAHAQAKTVGLVPAPVVRLERALAQRIHSTRGAGYNSPVTGSRRASHVASWGQLAPLAHERPGDRTVMDMRHRSTPVQTCQRYAVREDRVNSAAERQAWHRTPRVSPRHAAAWGQLVLNPCGQLVDPQGRKALASMHSG